MKEGWVAELKKQKEGWAAAEKGRRDIWLADKTKQVKELTVKVKTAPLASCMMVVCGQTPCFQETCSMLLAW